MVSDATLSDVRSAAAAGFQPAIAAGIAAVMMSHVTFAALGSRPASLEPAAYGLLRSLGFDGLAVTDAIGMSAILDEWSLAEAAVQALIAAPTLSWRRPAQSTCHA